jgi:hypothetical protein
MLVGTVFGGLGGLAGVLQFVIWMYDLQPKDVRGFISVGWPGWAWLMLGLVLFGISIALSLVSYRMMLKTGREAQSEQAELVATLKREHLQEMDRITSQLNSDLSRAKAIVQQFRDEKHEAIEEAKSIKGQLAVKDREIQQLKPLHSADGIPIFNYPAIYAEVTKNRFPHNTDLRGEILEILHETEYSFLMFAGYQVLLNVRMTNRSDDVLTITRWKLRIDIGNDHWSAEQQRLTDSMMVERNGSPDLFKPSTPSSEEIIPFPDQPLQKGVPQSGWLLFKVVEWTTGLEFPSSGQFTLFALDSFGDEHLTIRPCARYISRGRITHQKS